MGPAPTNPSDWKRSIANWIARCHPSLARARLSHAISRNAPRAMRECLTPGLQVSFVLDGSEPTTLCLGVASNATRETMTERHRFRLGSITKPIVTLAILRLVDEGVIALDEPLGTALADLCPHLDRDRLERLTPRLLLSHASGLAPVHPPRSSQPLRSSDWLSDATRVRFERAPAEASIYTSVGFAMLEAVLEARLRQPIAAIARRALFQPLGLCRVEFECDAAQGGTATDLCDDHATDGACLPIVPSATMSSSGIVASTADVCRVLRDGIFTPRALSDHVRRELLIPQPVGMAKAEFSLGLHLYKGLDARSLGHGGHRDGHRSMVVVVPQRRAVLCAAVNGENGDPVIRRLTGLFRAITIG